MKGNDTAKKKLKLNWAPRASNIQIKNKMNKVHRANKAAVKMCPFAKTSTLIFMYSIKCRQSFKNYSKLKILLRDENGEKFINLNFNAAGVRKKN